MILVNRAKFFYVLFFIGMIIFSTTYITFIYAESEIILNPTDDAYVVTDLNDPQDAQGFNKLNTGHAEFLKVWYGWGITENNNHIFSPAILKFDLSSLGDSDVESAVLRLYAENLALSSGSQTISVYTTENSEWQEKDVTYGTAPLFQNVISRTNVDSIGWYEWVIPPALIQDSGNTISFSVSFENLTKNHEELVIFSSKEGSEQHTPSLSIKAFPRLEHLSSNMDKLYPTDDAYVIIDTFDPQDLRNYQKLNTGLLHFIRLSYAFSVDPEQLVLTTAYLKFDLSEIDKEKIESVNLKIKSAAVLKLGNTINVDVAYVPQNSWSESSLIYPNRPMPSLDSLVTAEISESESWISWDVTDFVTDDTELSLALGMTQVSANSEELVSFHSKENRTNAPYLEIKYSDSLFGNSEGGGCLIATAAYGSEMASQVQFLREIRDNHLMRTDSGTAFMTGFNQFYYSFSPVIADLERQNPIFRETVKLFITPMLSTLSLLNYVQLDSESSVLGYGLSIITLNVGIYFVSPVVGLKIVKKLLFKKKEIHN